MEVLEYQVHFLGRQRFMAVAVAVDPEQAQVVEAQVVPVAEQMEAQVVDLMVVPLQQTLAVVEAVVVLHLV